LLQEGKDVKQDDFKALKFFQKACGLNDGGGCFNLISTKKQFHPLGENQRQPSPSLTNQTLSECVDLGFKYVTGKDVKQDDFKALKFFQKAALKSSCLTPLSSLYINPRLEQPPP
jgi:TPR repeat protein